MTKLHLKEQLILRKYIHRKVALESSHKKGEVNIYRQKMDQNTWQSWLENIQPDWIVFLGNP